MSIENKIFNIEPLLLAVENAVSTGLIQLMKDFISDHQLFKETHESVLKIAGVQKKEIIHASTSVEEDDLHVNDEKTIKQSIAEMTQEMVQNEVQKLAHSFDQKINELTKNQSIMFSELISKIEDLKKDFISIKQSSKEENAVIIPEKENIVLNIEEQSEKEEAEQEED